MTMAGRATPRNLRRTASPTRQPETRLLTPRRAAKAATAHHRHRTSQNKGASLMPMNATGVSHIAILRPRPGRIPQVLLRRPGYVHRQRRHPGHHHWWPPPCVRPPPRHPRARCAWPYANGAKPTLTMTSHPGEAPDGTPHQTGPGGHQPHFIHRPPTPKRWPKTSPPGAYPSPLRWQYGLTQKAKSAASMCTTPTASWSSLTPAADG